MTKPITMAAPDATIQGERIVNFDVLRAQVANLDLCVMEYDFSNEEGWRRLCEMFPALAECVKTYFFFDENALSLHVDIWNTLPDEVQPSSGYGYFKISGIEMGLIADPDFTQSFSRERTMRQSAFLAPAAKEISGFWEGVQNCVPFLKLAIVVTQRRAHIGELRLPSREYLVEYAKLDPDRRSPGIEGIALAEAARAAVVAAGRGAGRLVQP